MSVGSDLHERIVPWREVRQPFPLGHIFSGTCTAPPCSRTARQPPRCASQAARPPCSLPCCLLLLAARSACYRSANCSTGNAMHALAPATDCRRRRRRLQDVRLLEVARAELLSLKPDRVSGQRVGVAECCRVRWAGRLHCLAAECPCPFATLAVCRPCIRSEGICCC